MPKRSGTPMRIVSAPCNGKTEPMSTRIRQSEYAQDVGARAISSSGYHWLASPGRSRLRDQRSCPERHVCETTCDGRGTRRLSFFCRRPTENDRWDTAVGPVLSRRNWTHGSSRGPVRRADYPPRPAVRPYRVVSRSVPRGRLPPDSSRTYRVQVGYADGQVAEIKGATDHGCVGTIGGSHTPVRGPEGLGVYGAVISAFGQQYADSYDPAAPEAPLVCPVDPREPDSVDVDGSSAALDTGWHLGKRSSMVMPLAAVRGLVCTWPHGESEPQRPEVSTPTKQSEFESVSTRSSMRWLIALVVQSRHTRQSWRTRPARAGR
jgi:hypothetical protein